MSDVIATNQTILVVGGGISGVTAAIEAAECGKQVILVEKNPSLGGRVSQLYKYFPKLCFPSCGMEINLRRAKANRNLNVLTMTEVSAVSGESGNYSVTLKTRPRYVNENCTACGECEKAVEAEFDSEYDYGMKKRKGAYLPFNMSYPQRYVIDPEHDRHRRRREGEGRLQVRRHRSRHAGIRDHTDRRRHHLGHRLAAIRCRQDPAIRP